MHHRRRLPSPNPAVNRSLGAPLQLILPVAPHQFKKLMALSRGSRFVLFSNIKNPLAPTTHLHFTDCRIAEVPD